MNLEPADNDPDVALLRVLRDDGTADPATDPKLPREIVMRAYREMRRIRVLDVRMIALQRQGRVGFYGSAQGQEATPIATGLVLDANDWVFPALREQATMLVRGFPLESFVAQVFGNSADVLKAKASNAMPATRATTTATPASSVPSSKRPTSDGSTMSARPVTASATPVKMSSFFIIRKEIQLHSSCSHWNPFWWPFRCLPGSPAAGRAETSACQSSR